MAEQAKVNEHINHDTSCFFALKPEAEIFTQSLEVIVSFRIPLIQKTTEFV
jgi:hypothetical protein